MIKDSGVLLHQISNIVFLGDMFANHTFENSLRQKIGIAPDNVELLTELQMPEIVAVYDKWDENAFDEEKKKFADSASEKYIQDRKRYVEQQTRDLKNKAQVAENEGRLQDATDIYEQILRIDGNDRFAKTRIEAIRSQIEQIERVRKQIEDFLEKARQSFQVGDLTEAIRNCDEILRLQSDNVDAKKIKADAEDVLNRRELLEQYIGEMDKLIKDGRFYDARNILPKVDALNINDARLKEIRDKIDAGITNIEIQIREKCIAYETAFQAGDYQQCLRLCDELLAIGADSSVWTENRHVVMEKMRQEQIFQDNYKLAREARLNGEWNKVVEYAEKALKIKDDDEAKSMLQEANIRLSEIFKKKQFENEMDKIEKLITLNKNDEAEYRLKSLEKSLKRDGVIDGYMETRIKRIRKRLFDFGQSIEPKPPLKNQPSDGFDWETMSQGNGVTFANKESEHSKLNNDDDFFSRNESKNKITNDDFDFDNR